MGRGSTKGAPNTGIPVSPIGTWKGTGKEYSGGSRAPRPLARTAAESKGKEISPRTRSILVRSSIRPASPQGEKAELHSTGLAPNTEHLEPEPRRDAAIVGKHIWRIAERRQKTHHENAPRRCSWQHLLTSPSGRWDAHSISPTINSHAELGPR